MWTVLGIILIAAGAALIYSVLVKKFPQLKLIDLSTLAKERHAEVKTRIMKNRFDRGLGAQAHAARPVPRGDRRRLVGEEDAVRRVAAAARQRPPRARAVEPAVYPRAAIPA